MSMGPPDMTSSTSHHEVRKMYEEEDFVINKKENVGISGKVKINIYNGDYKYEELSLVEPDKTIESKNVCCNSGLRYLIQSGDAFDFNYLALGTSSPTCASTDTELASEEYRKVVTDQTIDGQVYKATTFLGAADGNGYTYNELGLINSASPGGILLDHSTFTPFSKDNTKTVTIEVDVTFTPG